MLLAVALCITTMFSANAQIKIGANLGLQFPLGNYGDLMKTGFGGDINGEYLITDTTIKVTLLKESTRVSIDNEQKHRFCLDAIVELMDESYSIKVAVDFDVDTGGAYIHGTYSINNYHIAGKNDNGGDIEIFYYQGDDVNESGIYFKLAEDNLFLAVEVDLQSSIADSNEVYLGHLYEIMKIFGKERIKDRFNKLM